MTSDSVTLKSSTQPKFCAAQHCCQLCNCYGPSHSYSWWDSKFSFWRWACWQHLIFIHVVAGLCFSPLDDLKCSVLAKLGPIFSFCMYRFFLLLLLHNQIGQSDNEILTLKNIVGGSGEYGF